MSDHDEEQPDVKRDTERDGVTLQEDRASKSAKAKETRRNALGKKKSKPGVGGLDPALGLPPINKLKLSKSAGVGYGQPPAEHRFQPGVSGNPRGRPIGAKTRRLSPDGYRFHEGLRAELERSVKYRENGEDREMPAIQAVIRQHINKAMQGVIGSARLIVDAAGQVENYDRRQHERLIETMIEYKQSHETRLRALERNPDRAQAAEIPLPHPDHIEVDFVSGEVLLKGPATEAERYALEKAWELRERFREYVKAADEILESETCETTRKFLIEARQKLVEQIQLFTDALGDGEDGSRE
ncbi:DUF5681 domain-containing protein [Defluviimonas sp. WL0024]|uniref:DUF5681 domain-containing protein n=1 Tax=Albidovulum salinarum TaxID=2984153 RepID=A0ABT2WZ74_9RHOB|nr:DUF5681 domain-containing protein [Defluviimonas sp. WL0024]MCU9846725.1 DUF5681 domain-containing protein [Defluviimonas sp. WL0024]